MVSALHGVLLECDEPTREFILSLNEGKPTAEKFVIYDLDDTRLFVQPTVAPAAASPAGGQDSRHAAAAPLGSVLGGHANSHAETPEGPETMSSGEAAAALATDTHASGRDGSPGSDPEQGPEDVAAALVAFRGAAERRARQYGLFKAGFQRYLAARDEGAFRRLMAEVTAEFQAVNGLVRGLEARLSERLNRPDLAALLRAVQDGERDVLRFTLVLQALKKAFSDGNFSWQQPEGICVPADVPVSVPGGEGEHTHASSVPGSSCCGAAPEPTEADFRAALAEATQAVEAAAAVVAEATEELRYKAAELAGEG
ncbi:hypothetical protein WJX81_004133 [Elliptochloris bilobata]|uniref:Uncharacterized protein n=1 Tax=Elliptochloris bilobata TaxID=381761 RepID=A0AAW1QNN8_9CHLO